MTVWALLDKFFGDLSKFVMPVLEFSNAFQLTGTRKTLSVDFVIDKNNVCTRHPIAENRKRLSLNFVFDRKNVCTLLENSFDFWLLPWHDDVIKLEHFPRYWPFVRGIHRSPVNSPHKGLWCGVLMLSLICAWINRWVNNRDAGDWRRHHAHYDVIVMGSRSCRMTVVFKPRLLNYLLGMRLILQNYN